MVSPTTQSISETAQLKIIPLIAKELGVGTNQVQAAVVLLDEGATVPFIARYRKEVTGNLDDTHLRTLEERLLYLRELELRRAAILASIEEQGKLTDALRASIEAAATKQGVEDLYLPYKPKRRTRAQIAREAGLEPLADALLADPMLDPEQEAVKYVNVRPAAEGVEAINVPDAKTALEGARDILVERFAETADLLAKLRTRLWDQGVVTSTVVKGQETAEEEKFRDYYAYSETIRTIPSHRALALFRGRTLGVLKIDLGLGEALEAVTPHPCVSTIAAHVGIEDRGRRADQWLYGSVRLDVASQNTSASYSGAARAIARSRRSRGDQDFRPQSARAVAGGTRRTEGRAWSRSRHPHGLQGGGGRCDRQVVGDDDDLSPPAAQRLAGIAGDAGPAGRATWS